jgi:hypothetical protein
MKFACRSERADRVYALNVALFPLSEKVDDPFVCPSKTQNGENKGGNP